MFICYLNSRNSWYFVPSEYPAHVAYVNESVWIVPGTVSVDD